MKWYAVIFAEAPYELLVGIGIFAPKAMVNMCSCKFYAILRSMA
jgi:hypothetical protein